MPDYLKTLVCLANSRKNSGRCIAGKVVEGPNIGEWIRPVSSRPDKELNAFDRQYERHPTRATSEPNLLDVITIACTQLDPHPYQGENHLINEKCYWVWVRQATFGEVRRMVDPLGLHLWGLTASSSYHGQNDRVLAVDAPSFSYSLRLIQVTDLRLRVCREAANFGTDKKFVRGYFSYVGQNYALMVTDPVIANEYVIRDEGCYDVGQSLLCLSLGEIYQGHAYKLIAGVMLAA